MEDFYFYLFQEGFVIEDRWDLGVYGLASCWGIVNVKHPIDEETISLYINNVGELSNWY